MSAICSATDKQLGAIAAPRAVDAQHRDRAVADLVAREIPIDDAELATLKAIRAPRGERVPYADAVAQAGDDIAMLPRIVVALRGGSSAALDAITEESSALSEIAVASMKRLHLRACARNL